LSIKYLLNYSFYNTLNDIFFIQRGFWPCTLADVGDGSEAESCLVASSFCDKGTFFFFPVLSVSSCNYNPIEEYHTDACSFFSPQAARGAGRLLTGVYKDPSSCFGVPPGGPQDDQGLLIPLNTVIQCLQKIRLPEEFAVRSVEAYRDAFAAGYGYYYYNNDPLDSDPLANPLGWEIYNGTSGGQVNYEKAFNDLISDIKKNGADGMLAFKISDIITRARDAHSDQVSWEMGTLSLVRGDDGPTVWLNLDKPEGSSEVRVIANVVGTNGTGVAETKVVSTINGQDPLKFLIDLTSNPALGVASQFRSPGVRMNVFLGFQRTDNDLVRWKNLRSAGDVTKLPPTLKFEYDDGSSSLWGFTITVPENLAFLPVTELEVYLSSPAGGKQGPLALYTNMVENRPAPAGRREMIRRFDIESRDYYILPGQKDSDVNILGFTIFKDSQEKPPATFSGYTVVNGDTMVWKLPTFNVPNNFDDVINFWNVMVTEAQEKDIKKLIIDISDNSGGSIRNAYTAVGLLYPDAPYEDVVHWYTTRISDVMLTLGSETLPAFQSIMDALTTEANIDTLLSFMNETSTEDVVDVLTSVLQVLTNAGSLAISTGNCDAPDFGVNSIASCLNNGGNDRNWINVNYTSMSGVLRTAAALLNSDAGVTDGFDEQNAGIFVSFLNSIKTAINRPSNCLNDTCPTQITKQGGVKVLSSDYFKSPAMEETVLKQVRKLSRGNPFESYALLSNANIVGSAANIFESALRHISRKHSATMPKTTAVSLGCLGEASQCDMTSFQGQIAMGNKFVGSLYAMYGVLSALEQFLNVLPKSVVSELDGISQRDIKDYDKAVNTFLDVLPKPPAISNSLPQYNSLPIYSLEITRETIPQEFFNRPPDEYLAYWPAPKTTSFENQQPLPVVYEKLQQFF
jgi:hypothetical protein